jgi:hypothetical protein
MKCHGVKTMATGVHDGQVTLFTTPDKFYASLLVYQGGAITARVD